MIFEIKFVNGSWHVYCDGVYICEYAELKDAAEKVDNLRKEKKYALAT